MMQDNIDKRFPLVGTRKYPIIMKDIPYYTGNGYILISYKVDKNLFGQGEQFFFTGISAGSDSYSDTLDLEHIIGYDFENIKPIVDNCYSQMSKAGSKLKFSILTYFSAANDLKCIG